MRSQWRQALALARLGLPVFPLPPNSKAPNTRAATYKTATTDEAQIRAWAGELSDHNYGVSPGPGHALVLDLDVRGDGETSLASLEIEHGLIPYFLKVRTPSGGLHLYAWLPEGHPPVRSTIRRLGPGIDTKCDSGHVVGPGCAIDGAPYEVEEEDDEAGSVPDWLLERCGEGTTRPEGDQPPACDELDAPQAVDAALDYVERRPVTEEGARNDTAYKTACRVRDLGISREQCLEIMLKRYNKRKCRPQLESDEMAGVVESAYQRAQNRLGAMADTSAFDDVRPTSSETGNPTPDENPFARSLLTVPEVKAMRKPEYLIHKTLVERQALLLWGLHSTYKSFLSLDAGLSVAAGLPWLGLETRQTPVIYVAGEGEGEFKPRIEAWLRAKGLDNVPDFYLLPVSPLFYDPEQCRMFGDVVREKRAGLVILDTLARAMAGMDENAQKDAGLFIARVDELRHQLHTSMVLVHHAVKSGKAVRGSTVLPNSFDTVVRVEGARGLQAKLTMTKQRSVPWEKPLAVAGVAVGESLVFERLLTGSNGLDREELLDETRQTAMRRLIGDASPSHLTTGQIVDALVSQSGAEKETVRSWVKGKGKTRCADLWLKDGDGGNAPLIWGTTEALDAYVKREGAPDTEVDTGVDT